jgi:hypothetical protein
MSDTAKPDVTLPTAPSSDAPKKTYDASCHCGAFRYSVAVSPPLDDPDATVMECNCSICVCNGYLFVYVPNDLVVFTESSIEQFKVSRIFALNEADFRGIGCTDINTVLLVRLQEDESLLLRHLRRILHGPLQRP